MSATGNPGIKVKKYSKLNVVVILIIIVMLMIVFFWYERNLDKIDAEMTKKTITVHGSNALKSIVPI
jgi:hypothetical protein